MINISTPNRGLLRLLQLGTPCNTDRDPQLSVNGAIDREVFFVASLPRGNFIFVGYSMGELARRSAFGVISSLCLSAIAATVFTVQAQAVSIVFDGGALPAVPAYPGNGTDIGQNNVINAPLSGISEGATGPGQSPGDFLVGRTNATLGNVSITGAAGQYWGVNWWFAGAESGDRIQLTTNGLLGGFSFAEDNQNNQCSGSNCPTVSNALAGPKFLGQTLQLGNGLIDFALQDLTTLKTVNNTTNSNAIPFTNGAASLVFAYLTAPNTAPGVNIPDRLFTTNDANSTWFLFAFNDDGSPDDNHDDFVGFAQVFAFPPGITPPGVPLPPALVLFGSALLGLTWLARRRRMVYERS